MSNLTSLYVSEPEKISMVVIHGLWQWCEDVESGAKDSVAFAAKTARDELYKVVRAICPDHESQEHEVSMEPRVVEGEMTKLLVLCRPQLIPRASWIELCLRTGTDPGGLAAKNSEECLAQILTVTENPVWKLLPAFQSAAFSAAAELAFVAPDELTPLIVAQIGKDLGPAQLADIGPTEAAIYRTPEGTPFIDVLSRQPQTQQVSKSSKDYDTLKWEEN